MGITQNPNGRDLTTRDPKDPFKLNFYDWLCVEIFAQEYWSLNQYNPTKLTGFEGPKHIFVPFGSGDLFCNLISFIESEARRSRFEHDEKLKYLLGNHELPFKNIGVYGATSNNPKTSMKKLYSAHRPMLKQINKKVDALIEEGILAKGSGIYDLEDRYINQAIAEANHPQQRLNTEYSGIAGLGLYLKTKSNSHDLHRMYLNDGGEFELQQHDHITAHNNERVVVVNTGLFYEPDYMSVDI